MKKLMVQYPGVERFIDELKAICEGRLEPVVVTRGITEEDFYTLVPGTTVLIGDFKPAWLVGCEDLEWIQISWAGIGPYVQEERIHHLRLTNSTGVYGTTIAEHIMGLLTALARRVPAYERNRSAHCWKDVGSEWALEGKTALVLGTGDLGNAVAKRLSAFEMHVVGLSRSGKAPAGVKDFFDERITTEQLDAYLPKADAVIVCLPGTPETAGMLDAAHLDRMKQDAILVNVGRGTVVDNAHLAELLQAGKLWGAGIDVTDPEPLPVDHPLWDCENVIITPHVAGIGFGHLQLTEDRLWRLALDNLKRYLNGEPLLNEVDWSRGY